MNISLDKFMHLMNDELDKKEKFRIEDAYSAISFEMTKYKGILLNVLFLYGLIIFSYLVWKWRILWHQKN